MLPHPRSIGEAEEQISTLCSMRYDLRRQDPDDPMIHVIDRMLDRAFAVRRGAKTVPVAA